MIPRPITIGGKTGTVMYLDAEWHPVRPEQATMAKVLFDDGSVSFYTTEEDTRKREYVRDAKGQFAETGRQLQGDEDDPVIVYHGTAKESLDGILKEGLRAEHAGEVWPQFSKRGQVYITTNDSDAIEWAQRTAAHHQGNAVPGGGIYPVVILKIRIPADQVHRLLTDSNFPYDTSIKQFKGDIPPEWIEEAKIGTPSDDAGWDDYKWKKVKIKKEEGDQIIYVVIVLPPSKEKPEGIGGITRKFDAAKHPRGEDGRFIEATAPRIFNRPEEVEQYESWGEKRWQWKTKPGLLLTGEPLTREQLPPVLYHVTTNAPAVESSGVLLGLQEGGGLGGGQAEGVSFTTSKEDAHVILRELRRAVQIARGEVGIEVFEEWARNDELQAGLPEGTLAQAVAFSRESWEVDKNSLERTFVWDKNLPEEQRGWVGPPPVPAERERIRRSLIKDALNAYLIARDTVSKEKNKPILKNPILFGRQEHLAKLNLADIQILEVPSAQIPEGALVTTGSDKFLHEVRAYSDVPMRRRVQSIAKFDPNQPRDAQGQWIPVTRIIQTGNPLESKDARTWFFYGHLGETGKAAAQSKVQMTGQAHEAVEGYLPKDVVGDRWKMYSFHVPSSSVKHFQFQITKKEFDESKHPRYEEGSSEGGQFKETGRAGAATPDPVLAAQAKTGIAAVEKLLPEAVRTAEYENVPGTWDLLNEDAREKVRKYHEGQVYDYWSDHLDTHGLDADVKYEIEHDIRDVKSKDIAEAAKKRVVEIFQEHPITTGIGTKMLDVSTIHVDEKYFDVLQTGALRLADGKTLTPFELGEVVATWREERGDIIWKEVAKYQETDEYLARREQMVLQKVREAWNTLGDSEKFRIASTMHYTGDLPLGNIAREPKKWTTGVETGTHSEDDYARTHTIALKLTELRTDELRKERGLLGVKEAPTYNIEKTYPTGDSEYGVPSPSGFMVKDSTGRIVAFATSEEEAEINAKRWVNSVMESANIESAKLIEDVWRQWKLTVSEGLGLSLQLAAARELGGHHRMTDDEVVEAERSAEDYGGMETIQAYVRAQWEVTQMVMKKAGEDKVRVYRGLMLEGEKVNATANVFTDAKGQSKPGATNISVLVDETVGGQKIPNKLPWSVRETVVFDFDGKTFNAMKDRKPEEESWQEVDADTKKQVHDIWMDNVKALVIEHSDDKTWSVESGAKLWEELSESGKMQTLFDYRRGGKMPPPPFEPTYITVQRRIEEQLSDYEQIRTDKTLRKLPELDLKRSGAQSTTGTIEVANDWGGVGNLPLDPTRVVLRIEAPSTSVLSLPVYGQNDVGEHESVLMGTKDKWLWDAWRNRAPTFATTPIADSARKADTVPLVIDLQDADRGKPHWMSTVNWQSVAQKFDEAKHPRDKEGQFAKAVGTPQEFIDEDGVKHVGDFVELYHGTSRRRANKIIKEGFKIRAVAKQTMGGDSESNRDYIWLAKRPESAKSYSEFHQHPTVLTVRLPVAEYEKLKRLNSGPDSVWSRDVIPAKYLYLTTAKWDEYKHPRDKEGQFTHGAQTTAVDPGAGGGRGVAVPSSPGRPSADPEAHDVAQAYNAQHGLPPIEHGYVAVDEVRAGRIADAYDALPVDDSDNPAVQQAYAAFEQEINDQWDFIVASGMTFEPWAGEGQPYANSQAMVEDVRTNKHMYFFVGGNPHPLGKARDANGLTLTDKFRAVHDYFGHAAGGYGFGPRGEENAWLSHSQMLSPQARRAMTPLTRGQNSWVNFGRHNYHPDGTYKNIPMVDRPFAPQKAALLPDIYVRMPGEAVLKWEEAKHPRNPKGTGKGGEFTESAPILQGVDFKANAETQIAEFRRVREFLSGQPPDLDAEKAAEAELRALPLVHGTSVAGAAGAAKQGLLSHEDMEVQKEALKQDIDNLKDYITNIVGENADWFNIPFWTEEDIAGLGLDRYDAKALLGYVQELQDIEKVIQGTTHAADKKAGLDQFVFMTHGKKHQDYGDVAVIIDNEVIQDGWATEKDIVLVQDPDPLKDMDERTYSEGRLDAYRKLIVKGDDYYKVAAAKAGTAESLAHRSREQLFEVKAKQVPKSAVLGFVVTEDEDVAQRLVDKGQAGKILFVTEAYTSEKHQFIHDQLKHLQRTGMWDEEALEAFREKHEGVYLL